MIKKIFLLGLISISFNCKNSNSENYQISQNIKFETTDEHPGKKLLETNCYVCHNPTTEHDSRIAPPMIAIKKHYITENTSKEEFISELQEWVKNPSEEKARMFGAVRRFGVMPKTPYPEETIHQIADYIFENSIEEPEWFEAHYQEEKGKGNRMGSGKGNGRGIGNGRGMGNGQGKILQKNVDKSNMTFSEIGMHYALSTKQELGKNLMGTIQKKGTVKALKFCNERAYAITDSMSKIHGAVIKRVSDQPRNQSNQASGIELGYISAFKEIVKEGKESNPIVVDYGEKIEFYYPIVTNEMCLQCHGEVDEQISSETFNTLKALYPQDKAIGYDINNVRGIWSITFNKSDE